MAIRALVLVVVVLACLVAAATAMRCYQCTSTAAHTAGQQICTTTADTITLKECGQGIAVCYKTRAMVGNAESIVRGCGKAPDTSGAGLGDNQCQDHDIAGVKTSMCNCNTDACNGAAKISSFATGLSILFAIVLSKLF